MKWYNVIIGLIKRIKSDLPLLITGSLLFYYLFKNELDMLNSYAENELMPHITNDTDGILIDNLDESRDPDNLFSSGDKVVESFKNKEDKIKDSSTVDLYDYNILLEKNRFFPIIQDSVDGKDMFTRLSITPSDTIKNVKSLSRKLKYLLVDKFTWQASYDHIDESYPHIQTKKFMDNGFAVDAQLSKIKTLFQETFELYSATTSNSIDELKPISRKRIDNGNGFGRTLIGSIDMFYLLDMDKEISDLIDKLTLEDTLVTSKNLLNTNENFITIISSLISGYELSEEREKIFLKIAKQLSKVAIKAYDTPINGLPLSELPFKSMIQNRFALRKSSIFEIAGNILELIKMSSLTKENVYISTGLNVFRKMVESSRNVFNVDYLFPTIIDPSGCQILKNDKHEERVISKKGTFLKTIYNGEYINCMQRDTFFSANDYDNVDSTGEQDIEFIDLINEDGNVNYLFSLLKSYHLLNGNGELDFKDYFEKSFEIMNKYMFYKPNLPSDILNKEEQANFVFFTPISASKRQVNDLEAEDEILIKQSLRVKSQHCQLGGMFLFASKLFKNATYSALGEQLINGCIILPKLTNLNVIPESASFDKCNENGNCFSFDTDKKVESLLDGSFLDDKFELESTSYFTAEDILQANKIGLNNVEVSTHEIALQERLKEGIPLIKADRKRSTGNPIASNRNDAGDNSINSPEGNNLENKKVYKLTTSKADIMGKPFSVDKKKWTNSDHPFYINSIDSKFRMRPEFIESLFYAYRITGDDKYRRIAAETLEAMIGYIRHVHKKHVEISAIEDLYTLKARDELPYFWFTRTLKYYYLIFSDVSTYSLDDYIFNGDGHIFKKTFLV